MKTKIIISEELRRFLGEKALTKRFIHHCKTYSNHEHVGEITRITAGFVFARTPEGHKFWWRLSEEFNSI